jgi:predicted dehydrogenase
MSERAPLTVAVAGCGGFARHHIEAWLRNPRARLVAIVDRDRIWLRVLGVDLECPNPRGIV